MSNAFKYGKTPQLGASWDDHESGLTHIYTEAGWRTMDENGLISPAQRIQSHLRLERSIIESQLGYRFNDDYNSPTRLTAANGISVCGNDTSLRIEAKTPDFFNAYRNCTSGFS